MKPYYVLLMAECLNENTAEEKVIEVPFKFASKKLWEYHSDDYFDDIAEQFNEWLQNNGYRGWYMDDAIETVKSINSKDAISPCEVLE